MISCLLLSAGESRRFGAPKALAPIDQQTVIQRLQTMLLASNIDEIKVILGAHHTSIAPHVFNHNKVRIVYNKDYKLGQTTSVQAGISSVDPAVDGIMIVPVDCPWIQTSTVDRLVGTFQAQNPALLIATYQGQRGHPLLINASLIPAVLSIPVDKGLNSLFTAFPPALLEISDPGVVKTFNTQADLKHK